MPTTPTNYSAETQTHPKIANVETVMFSTPP
jgi:hypothetical protein